MIFSFKKENLYREIMRFVDFKNKKCFLILQETFFILWYNIKKLSD